MLPCYKFISLEPTIQNAQQSAITDVVTEFPTEKRKGLWSYDLPPSCEELLKVLLPNLKPDIQNWVEEKGFHVKDVGEPPIKPQAFVLAKDNTSILLKGYMAIAIALGNTAYKVELVSSDKMSSREEKWDPKLALCVYATGLRAKDGNIRFLYIPFQLEPAKRKTF